MADLLLELFSEEIPARMQEDALEYLCDQLQKRITGAKVRGFVTPRRLAAIASDIPTVQKYPGSELKGPKIDAPEQAIQGFLKKSNMKLEQLEKRDGIYIANIKQDDKPTAEVLKAAIEDVLAKFPWPKSMRWADKETIWVRPLHNILCIFDGKVVPVEFAGVKANNKTFGHRFLVPKPIEIKKAEDYEKLLEKAFVIADREKRKAKIVEEAEALAAKHKLKVKQDAGLLEEVTGLVEWPSVLMGNIDKTYMELPEEVLISEMRAHQKYFALVEKREVEIAAGKDVEKGRVPHLHAIAAQPIAPHFLIVTNMDATDKGKAIVAGNERVLRARLADGKFFWEQDRKKKLDEWAKGLKNVTFHAKLGSIADKVERVRILAGLLADFVKGADQKLVARAAALCKADLLTGMVGEFPELQGVMGRYYALAQHENTVVANAIRDHYLPLGPASPCPTAPESICVALADKLDTLIGMFNVGEKPTGSKDPFALRRAALGVIRIILENNVRLPLTSLKLHNDLLEFFSERLQVSLKDKGIRHDVVKAVMATGDDDLVRVVARAKALQDFLSTEDGKNLLAGYTRAANIVRIEEKKDKAHYTGKVEPGLLVLAEEKHLVEALEIILPSVKTAIAEEKFEQSMTALATLRTPVDRFFDKVTVNAEDKNLRINRLHILSQIRSTLDAIANFALIEG